MIKETMTVNIGDLCTHCGRDTSFGNGLFVNRIPSGADGRLMLAGGPDDVYLDVTLEGWMCAKCQSVECDKCGEMTLDYNIEDSTILCSDCGEKEGG
jgi:hypothetical protein